MTIQRNESLVARGLQPLVRRMRAPTFTLALLVVFSASPGCSQETFTVADGGAGTDGGGSATGGSPGTGGSASGGGKGTGGNATGGADGDACADGSVILEVRSDAPDAYCTPACDKPWVKIFDELGRPLTLEAPCLPDCTQCGPVTCPPEVCEPRQAFSESLERTWEGVHYVNDTCGAQQECHSARCLPAGSYRAEFCLERNATPGTTCTPSGEVDCLSQTFSWPSATRVQMTVNPPSDSEDD